MQKEQETLPLCAINCNHFNLDPELGIPLKHHSVEIKSITNNEEKVSHNLKRIIQVILFLTIALVASTLWIKHIPSGARQLDEKSLASPYKFSDIDKVDIVITWVNGSDPTYIQNRNDYIKLEYNPQRERDFSQLKYAFRSIKAYANWINHIYLVANEIPSWLDTNHPKVSVIPHKDFFETPEYLPTFNSIAIETNLYRIDGLSENFIYMNDDWFFNKDVFKEDWVSQNNEIIMHLGNSLSPNSWLKKMLELPKLVQSGHTPIWFNKKIIQEMREKFPTIFDLNSSFRRRHGEESAQMQHFYYNYLRSQNWNVTLKEHDSETDFHMLTASSVRPRLFKRLKKSRKKFIALNDDLPKDGNIEKYVAQVKEYLEWRFPEVSAYEKE